MKATKALSLRCEEKGHSERKTITKESHVTIECHNKHMRFSDLCHAPPPPSDAIAAENVISHTPTAHLGSFTMGVGLVLGKQGGAKMPLGSPINMVKLRSSFETTGGSSQLLVSPLALTALRRPQLKRFSKVCIGWVSAKGLVSTTAGAQGMTQTMPRIVWTWGLSVCCAVRRFR